MLPSVLRISRAPASIVRASSGCALGVQENLSKLFYSAQTPQAPDRKLESASETSTDPFLAHLQQKTEKELFEILRKQQQQPRVQDGDKDSSVRKSLEGIYCLYPFSCQSTMSFSLTCHQPEARAALKPVLSRNDKSTNTQDPVTATGEHGGPKGAYAGAEPTRYGTVTMQGNIVPLHI